MHQPKDMNRLPVNRPFEGLKSMVENTRGDGRAKKAQRAPDSVPDGPNQHEEKGGHTCSDEELFLKAVEGARPLDGSKKIGAGPAAEIPDPRGRPCPEAAPDPTEKEAEEIVESLKALVSGKAPFPVRQTPEFVKGPARDLNELLVKRLHNGEFSVQGYCDLHGLDTLGALEACEEFLKQAIEEGKRCLAFIHGRGLSSPRGPVLKEKVIRWVTRGPYRRLILAYSSAPAWDGGAGVTYVLLRHKKARPARSKQERRLE